jgi:hypothetical protein
MHWWSCPHRAATARRKSNPGEKSRPPRSLSRLGTPSAMRLVPHEGQQIPPSPVRQPAINFSLLSSLALSVRSTRTGPMAAAWDSRAEAQTFISPMEAETSQQPREIRSDKRGPGPRRLLRGVRSRGARAWGEDGPASGPTRQWSKDRACAR